MPSVKSYKEKSALVAWDDIRLIRLSDPTWEQMKRRLHLPENVRTQIEQNITLYSFHRSSHAGFPTREQALGSLGKLEQAATRLHQAFDKLNDRSVHALIDATQENNKKNARDIWRSRQKMIAAVTADILAAIKVVRNQKKGKPGRNTFALDHLVEQVGMVIQRHGKVKKLGRSKILIDFMLKAANAADPQITKDMVESALKRISN